MINSINRPSAKALMPFLNPISRNSPALGGMKMDETVVLVRRDFDETDKC
jgi:hypothetical protein